MAFDISKFTPIGGQGRAGVAPALYAYTDTASLGTIKGAGYFNALRDQVYKDDVMITITDSGTTAVLTIIFFLLVPASPLTTNVTVVTADISAA